MQTIEDASKYAESLLKKRARLEFRLNGDFAVLFLKTKKYRLKLAVCGI